MTSVSLSGVRLLFYFACVIILVIVVTVRKRLAVRAQDGPLLSSDDMLGVGGLQSLSQGTINDFQYNLLTNNAGRVMVLVELGHDTWSHVVAYGDRSQMGETTRTSISAKWLQPAVLEGDFPDYFHMYCNPELQDVVRELFTSDVMENFVDFCRSYDFELYHDTLYISKAEKAEDKDNQTTLIGDITTLLNKQGVLLRHITP
jgi:hypothetical protein